MKIIKENWLNCLVFLLCVLLPYALLLNPFIYIYIEDNSLFLLLFFTLGTLFFIVIEWLVVFACIALLIIFLFYLFSYFKRKKSKLSLFLSLILLIFGVGLQYINNKIAMDCVENLGSSFQEKGNKNRLINYLNDIEYLSGYKLLDLNNKYVEVENDYIDELKYVYNVSLNDNTDIVFQAYTYSTNSAFYGEHFGTNYNYYYGKFYLEEYNKNRNDKLDLKFDLDNEYLLNDVFAYYSTNEDLEKLLYNLEKFSDFLLNNNKDFDMDINVCSNVDNSCVVVNTQDDDIYDNYFNRLLEK